MKVTLLNNMFYYEILENISRACSLCYGIEPPLKLHEQEKFIKKRIKAKHESVLEHGVLSVLIETNRGVSHELVRHRFISVTQESTRYKKFTDVQDFVDTEVLDKNNFSYNKILNEVFDFYQELLANKEPLDKARMILPNALKTRMVLTANIREWRHFLNLRYFGITGKPHPDMQALAGEIYKEFLEKYPVFFEDLERGNLQSIFRKVPSLF